MKTKNRSNLHQLTVIRNPDLARKFQQASHQRVSIESFVKDFLCQFVSEDTKIAYLKDMEFFFEFLRSGDVIITHPEQIQSFHFQLYRDELMSRGLASATISRRLVAIRSFMKWSMGSGLISFNPLDNVKLPKVQTESETIAFDDDEAMKMILAPDESTHRGRTHRLAMVLLFNLGLRRAELVNVRLEHIYEDRGHRVLSVKGKGGKVRLIPLSPFVQKEIEKYAEGLRAAGFPLLPADYLLQSSDKGRKNEIPIDGSTIYRIINKYAKNLGINKRVSPHSCRATVISHLLDTQGRNIRDVASFAGHSNITTTERYDKRRNNLDHSAAYSVGFNPGEFLGDDLADSEGA
jgi:integrase/recombinase XerD